MKHLPKITLVFGFISLAFFGLVYYFNGFSNLSLLLWYEALILCSFFFLNQKYSFNFEFSKKDLVSIFILSLVLIPLYMAFIYQFPYQMHSDEILDMGLIKQTAFESKFDLFGFIRHDGIPQLRYLVFFWLTSLIGPITIFNVRIIGALWGFLNVILLYFVFKSFSNRIFAFCSALLLGTNHAYIIFTRAFFIKIPPIMIEIITLGFLYKAIKDKSMISAYFTGLVVGSSLYFYYSARVVVVIWLFLFLFFVILQRSSRKILLKLFLASLVGFMIMVLPISISSIKNPAGVNYVKKQLLLFPEGRAEGLSQNISNGLLLFNGKIPDSLRNYYNPKYGIVDPVTGVLILIGLARLIFKKDKGDGEIIMLASFLALWFIAAFIINMSPNYSRLLVILPLAFYFSVKGIDFLKKKVMLGLVVILAIWNVYIFVDYSLTGIGRGDVLGSTTRYIDSKKNQPNFEFFVASDSIYQYYPWGGNDYGWFTQLISTQQTYYQIKPESIGTLVAKPPFAIFTTKNLWVRFSRDFYRKYPALSVYDMSSDGHLVVIEVI